MGTAYLCHHGIKGQKWGVRRYQNEDGSLTADGRKRYLVGEGRDYYTIKKGTKTQRLTLNANETNDERKYVTFTEKDKKIYKDFYPKELVDSEKNFDYFADPRVYNITNTLVKDIKVANAKAYLDTFKEMYADKPVRDLAKWKYDDPRSLIQKIFGKEASEEQILAKNIDNINRARDEFDFTLQVRNNPVNKEFFERMKNKGYDAIEDQFSKKIDGTEGALIILDPSKSLRQTKISELTEQSGFKKEVSLKEGQKAFESRAADRAKKETEIAKFVESSSKTTDDVFKAIDLAAEKYGMDRDKIDEILRRNSKNKTIKHEDTDMNIYYESSVTDPGLEHHGIKGMKWGIRRFQNPDGSLTEAGKRRYGTVEGLRAAYDDKLRRKTTRLRRKAESTTDTAKAAKYSTDADDLEKEYKNWMEDRKNSQETKKKIAEEKEKAKADHEAEVKAKDAKEVADAVATGDPEKISEVMDKMTTQEIKDAINRVDTMKSLRDKIEPGLMKKGINVVSTAFKARAAEAVTEKIMKLGKDPDDQSGLSKEERDRMKRLKELTEATAGLGFDTKTNKDYSNAVAKAATEDEAKQVAKYVKDLEKSGVSHETAVQMGNRLMNQRMAAYENAKGGSGNDGGNQNGGDDGGGKPKKPKGGESGQTSSTDKESDSGASTSSSGSSESSESSKSSLSLRRAWYSETPEIKKTLNMSTATIKPSAGMKDLLSKLNSSSTSSIGASAAKKTPFGSGDFASTIADIAKNTPLSAVTTTYTDPDYVDWRKRLSEHLNNRK